MSESDFDHISMYHFFHFINLQQSSAVYKSRRLFLHFVAYFLIVFLNTAYFFLTLGTLSTQTPLFLIVFPFNQSYFKQYKLHKTLLFSQIMNPALNWDQFKGKKHQ